MRKVFHIITRERKGQTVYHVVNLAGTTVRSRVRLKHAREVAKCLDRGHEPPIERLQFLSSLVRMRVKFLPNMKRRYMICTSVGPTVKNEIRPSTSKQSALN